MSQTETLFAQALAAALRAEPISIPDKTLGVGDRRLAYYATPIDGKTTWHQTDEGYRIYKNVPICRTGSQQYVGCELKKLPGYRDEWNIGDNDIVTVYRDAKEVFDPAALASFEGKSVLDEHPPDPQVLVDALDELDGVSMGHGQNIREGGTMADGERCVIADLHVKNPGLNMKIEAGTKEVSCGYRFVLDKDADGRYVQTKIRGNHIAIVPRGRAGRLVGIGDSSPEGQSKGNTTMADLLTLGLHTLAKTATPDEFGAALKLATPGVKDSDEAEKKAEEEKAAKEKAAKDAEAEKEKEEKAVKDALAEMEADGGVGDGEHPDDCDCKKCMEDKGAKDDEADFIIPESERPRSEFSVADCAKHLDGMKTAIARSKDKGAVDSFKALSKALKSVQRGVKDGQPDPFVALTRIGGEGVGDSEPEIPAFRFFSGVDHATGLKNYNDYLASRQSR